MTLFPTLELQNSSPGSLERTRQVLVLLKDIAQLLLGPRCRDTGKAPKHMNEVSTAWIGMYKPGRTETRLEHGVNLGFLKVNLNPARGQQVFSTETVPAAFICD